MIPKNPPPKRYKVGEILKHTKMSRQTIHNYTLLGLIQPIERTPSGHRLYDDKVFERLRKIEMLKLHHTIAEIKELIEADDAAAASNSENEPPQSAKARQQAIESRR